MREEQLVGIATHLFASKGYDATSLRDIADAAGITKAALYYWFPEKERLFVRVVENRMGLLIQRVSLAIDQAPDPIAKIRAFLLASAEQMDASRSGWVTSSINFWSNFDGEQREILLAQRDRYEQLLRQCVVDAVAQGKLRPVDPALTSRLLLSGLNQLPRWHKIGGRLSAAQVVEAYLDMLLDGLYPKT
ncbi:MAG: TetR/AcrR family transcriptional regulator [Rhizobacter sp.]|nr:TetR/AcrR family transcriptional regulator [Rhizobacter sp.]